MAWRPLLFVSPFYRRSVLHLSARGAASGWSYDTLDPVTGRTALEALYDAQSERIRRVFEEPIPALPPDGNVAPDLLVGFAHYAYMQRDQYRALLAAALQMPISAIRLSVAWSGRFDVTRFHHSQKVCGVLIAPSHRDGDLDTRIAQLVEAINSQRRGDMLALHMVQASTALPEVQCAVADRNTARLRQWLRAHILSPHLVVVLRGPAEAEGRVVEGWAKALQARRVVPRVLGVAELTQRVRDAVRDGEVDGWEAPTPLDAAEWERMLQNALCGRGGERMRRPWLFVHGECAGGAAEMRYLAANREALDALLLHPNDVAFKKKFMSRFRASHARLRMAEEMSNGGEGGNRI